MLLDIEILKIIDKTGNIKSIYRIGVRNDLDKDNSQEFESIITAFVKGGVRHFLFDLEHLKFIDSSAIGKIISMTKEIRKHKGEIVITKYTDAVHQIATLINLEKMIKFELNKSEALKYFSNMN